MMKLIKEYKSWNLIKRDEVHVNVLNLQTKIYKYSKSENINQMRYFQRKLVNSKHAKLLAVCVVSQDNRGKKTVGIDGVSELTPAQRFQMTKKLVLDGKATKIKRVWIPKATGKLRPLGIPTLEDRAKQCLVKMALEPEW